ncbi:hypothetical protein K439DRAFT_1623478 [Ramaria rubella]|nr:hypothetical protein K439DRAFT_1623478 [Ramaria rubella]
MEWAGRGVELWDGMAVLRLQHPYTSSLRQSQQSRIRILVQTPQEQELQQRRSQPKTGSPILHARQHSVAQHASLVSPIRFPDVHITSPSTTRFAHRHGNDRTGGLRNGGLSTTRLGRGFSLVERWMVRASCCSGGKCYCWDVGSGRYFSVNRWRCPTHSGIYGYTLEVPKVDTNVGRAQRR